MSFVDLEMQAENNISKCSRTEAIAKRQWNSEIAEFIVCPWKCRSKDIDDFSTVWLFQSSYRIAKHMSKVTLLSTAAREQWQITFKFSKFDLEIKYQSHPQSGSKTSSVNLHESSKNDASTSSRFFLMFVKGVDKELRMDTFYRDV